MMVVVVTLLFDERRGLAERELYSIERARNLNVLNHAQGPLRKSLSDRCSAISSPPSGAEARPQPAGAVAAAGRCAPGIGPRFKSKNFSCICGRASDTIVAGVQPSALLRFAIGRGWL
jgi:hypothetical protein